jgi:hypothetical protein
MPTLLLSNDRNYIGSKPELHHGHQRMPNYFANDCCRDCAFVTSEYPVILSLENHCSRSLHLKDN